MDQDTGRKQSAAVDALIQLFISGYELPTSENKIKTPEELKKHRIDDVKEILNGCGGLNEYWFIRFFGQIFEITEHALDEAFRVGAMPKPKSDTVDETMLSFIERAQKHETIERAKKGGDGNAMLFDAAVKKPVKAEWVLWRRGGRTMTNAKGIEKSFNDSGGQIAFAESMLIESLGNNVDVLKRWDRDWRKSDSA